MVDGVKINDASTPTGAFDFANLTTDAVERIEILRGPQSTLYGSEAIGGVINIITRTGAMTSGGSIELYGGSHNTFKQSVTLYGGNKRANYLFSLSNIDSNGQTVSAPAFQIAPVDEDGFHNTNLTFKGNWQALDNLKLELSGQFIDALNEFDASADESVIPQTDYSAWTMKTSAEVRLFEGNLKSKLSLSRNSIQRDTTLDFGFAALTTFDSLRNEIEWRNDFFFLNNQILTAGFKWEEETGGSVSAFGNSSSKATTRSWFLQDQVDFSDHLFATIGIRHDDHSGFGKKTTWRIAPVYVNHATGTRIKASFGTGFKAPSLYQLYDTFSGNPLLRPESSKGWEIGFDQQLPESGINFGATYFNNDLETLIDFDNSTFRYFNTFDAQSSGVEIYLSYDHGSAITGRIDYTFTDARDSAGIGLLRRPKHKTSLSFTYHPSNKLSIAANVHYIGIQRDVIRGTFPPAPVMMDSYVTVDYSMNYQIDERFSLQGKIVNLGNTDYQPVNGYLGQEQGFYVGFKAKI
jgi:vitamin B12 transporter